MPTATTQRYELDQDAILNTFLEMVRINSPSGHEESMRLYMEERIRPYCDSHGLVMRSDAEGNLIVDVPLHESESTKTLLLSGHLDVVPPCDNIQPNVTGKGVDRMIESSQDTVLGADDKAGLTPVLEGVIYALENSLPRPKTKLIFTTREETGLMGAKGVADKELAESDFSVIFDHTGKMGTWITSAPTYINYKIEVTGKSVHAGIMPEQGINAIHVMGEIVNRISTEKLNARIDENTTANLGLLKGGKGTNVVPDYVYLEGEVRGHDRSVIDATLQKIEAVANDVMAKTQGAGCTFSTEVMFEGYVLDEAQIGVHNVHQAMHQTELKPLPLRTNGGSDNNVFMLRGLQGVVLSAGYVEPHTLNERVKLSEMVRCTELVINLLDTFAKA